MNSKRLCLWASIGIIMIILVTSVTILVTKDRDIYTCKSNCNSKCNVETEDGCGGKCAPILCEDGETCGNGKCF